MWEEAPKTEIFGIQVYTFGLYCAIGALCAVAAVCVLCRAERLKKGTAALLSLLSLLCGIICSRLVFCLLNDVALGGVPFRAWFKLSIGGFSLFGMIFGVFLGAWICSKAMGEKADILLDIVSVALPLMMAAERFGERVTEGFNISRQLAFGSFPDGTFLSVKDAYYEDVSFLATHLLCAICAVVLFLVLVFFLTRNRADGDLWILFMMLCGAGGIILESLRYDHFLEYSFVCFQQIFAAILLVWGVVLAGIRNRGAHKGIFRAAIISLPLSIGLVGGIEFALDRMSISHYVLYAVMFLGLAVPVVLGILLLVKRERPA